MSGEDFGLFAYLFALVSLISFFSKFGLPAMVISKMSPMIKNNQYEIASSLFYKNILLLLKVAPIVVLVLGIASFFDLIRIDSLFLMVILYFSAFLMGLQELMISIFRAMGHPLSSLAIEGIFRQSIFIILVLFNWKFFRFDLLILFNILMGSFLIVVAISFLYVFFKFRLRPSLDHLKNRLPFKSLLNSFSGFQICQLVLANYIFILYPYVGDFYNTGITRLAFGFFSIITFAPIALISVHQRDFANLFFENKTTELIQISILLSRRILYITILTIIVSFCLLVFYIWLTAFESSNNLVSIFLSLAIIQLINSAFMLPTSILQMIGMEHINFRNLSISLLLSIAIFYPAVKLFSFYGVAVSYGTCILIFSTMGQLAIKEVIGKFILPFSHNKK